MYVHESTIRVQVVGTLVGRDYHQSFLVASDGRVLPLVGLLPQDDYGKEVTLRGTLVFTNDDKDVALHVEK